jgi:hypothetical protein
MIYVKSVPAGAAAVVFVVALFTISLWALNLDARWFMGYYPQVSLPAMGTVFLMAFGWTLSKASRQR